MSKKILLLALAVAAHLALPAVASAQEAHIDGVTTFTGHAGASTISAFSEPTVTCSTATFTGSFDSGSTTTGSMSVDFTGCDATFLFFTPECHSFGSASGTVRTSGAFHVVTVSNKPAFLLTPATTAIICSNFSTNFVSGNLIGMITSPACNAESTKFTIVFNSGGGSTQEYMTYTGVKHDLTMQTEGEAAVTAGLTSTTTLNSATAGKLTCT
jgi:hypothetical protein